MTESHEKGLPGIPGCPEAQKGAEGREWGVRYRKTDGATYDAPMANEAGARHILAHCTGKGWSHPAVAVVRRDVGEWIEVA